jgi:hypothetical protein
LCGVKQGIRHLFTRQVRTLRNEEKLKRWQMLQLLVLFFVLGYRDNGNIFKRLDFTRSLV